MSEIKSTSSEVKRESLVKGVKRPSEPNLSDKEIRGVEEGIKEFRKFFRMGF